MAVAHYPVERLEPGAARPLLLMHSKSKRDLRLPPREMQEPLAGCRGPLQMRERRRIDDDHVGESGCELRGTLEGSPVRQGDAAPGVQHT